MATFIKGFVQKGCTSLCGPIFIFCRTELTFGRWTCFDMKKHCTIILLLLICHLFSRKNKQKKLGLLNEKKKPFFFIIYIIMLISYCNCFISKSEWVAEWAGFEYICFVVILVQYEVGQFCFLVCFSTSFKKLPQILKKPMLLKLLEVTVMVGLCQHPPS